MHWQTLHKMADGHLSAAECKKLIGPLNTAMVKAHVTTVNRAAMWFAQTGEESVLWTAKTEFASGAEYNWRSDLGNTHPGDGPFFKGRGYIQLTGRNNYRAFGEWIARHKGLGLLTHYDKNYFIKHPEMVAHPRFAWLAVVFYWIHDHNHGYGLLNKAADAGDIYTATLMVNGGTNGLARREELWNRYRQMGNEILPTNRYRVRGGWMHVLFKGNKKLKTYVPNNKRPDHPRPLPHH